MKTTKSISWSFGLAVTVLSNLLTYQIVRSLLSTRGALENQWIQGPEWIMSKDMPTSSSFDALPPLGKRLAYEQSFGFFDSIPNETWRRHYQLVALQQLQNPPRNENLNGRPSQWIYENMDPILVCPRPRKLGNPAGKWMCDPDRWVGLLEQRQRQQRAQARFLLAEEGGATKAVPPCLVYSIGSKGNFRWEQDFVELLGREDWCEIHIFDPSPAYESMDILQDHPHWHYHPWGWRGRESPKNYTKMKGTFLDFHTIRKRLGHEDRPIDIFKMDCEGCEWESMADWLWDSNSNISRSGSHVSSSVPDLGHILLETHSLPLPNRSRWAGNFGKLPPMPEVAFLRKALAQRGYVCYAKEVNSHQGLGRSVEWGFIRLRNDFFGRPINGTTPA
jgi:hypothetical protein